MLFQDIVFWFLAVAAVGASLGVVLVRDLFRAALLLVVVFVAVAGFFVMMSAEFLAVVQVLIYAGAIAILLIFAIMLTRDVQRGNLPNRLQIPAALFSALLLAALVVVATVTDWKPIPQETQAQATLVQTQAVKPVMPPAQTSPDPSTEGKGGPTPEGGLLADLLIEDFVLPFEAVSVLLLAAVIGAL
ncbi:MAG: NADH-quinone oxidoreductase subunit J, partial [Chloroflexota bacterium]